MAERPDEANAKLEQEFRRGVIVLATLSQLRAPQYGYSLRQALAEQGMVVEEGTLYPLLRRLEGAGPARQRMAHRGRTAAPLLHAERRGKEAATPN